jgi:hypothetical protein
MLSFKPSTGVKHKDVYLQTFDATKKQMYSDQTGKFPVPSSNGHKYIMVAVELDGNFIDAEPIVQSRKAKALTEAYQKTDGKPQKLSVQTGTSSTTKHLRN